LKEKKPSYKSSGKEVGTKNRAPRVDEFNRDRGNQSEENELIRLQEVKGGDSFHGREL